MGKGQGAKQKAKPSSSAKPRKAAGTDGGGGAGDDEPQQRAKSGKHKKGHGKDAGGALHYGDALERELARVGLRVAKITADGNCLFRAVSDQTEGDEGRHADLRQRACDLMAEQRAEFEPFVEDDQACRATTGEGTLDAYLWRMRKDGAWGGHMELQALSLLTGRNVYVYQEGQPRWTVKNHTDSAQSIHLSYHGGEHYNSVRLLDDYGRGPPRPITLGEGGAAAAQLAQERAMWTPADEARVAANCGCDSPALVQRALREAGGDVDAAIERVVQVMAAGDGGTAADSRGDAPSGGGSGSPEGHCAGAGANTPAAADADDAIPVAASCGGSCSHSVGARSQEDKAAQPGPASGAESEASDGPETSARASSCRPGGGAHQAAASLPSGGAKVRAKPKRGVDVGGSSAAGIGKKPARNKGCPCGSGKKFKSCCGATVAAAERRQRALVDEGAKEAAAGGALPAMLATLTI